MHKQDARVQATGVQGAGGEDSEWPLAGHCGRDRSSWTGILTGMSSRIHRFNPLHDRFLLCKSFLLSAVDVLRVQLLRSQAASCHNNTTLHALDTAFDILKSEPVGTV